MPVSTDPFALIVDDDAFILVHIRDILEGAGFRVLEAENGDAAIVILGEQGETITLLFTDVEMPGSTDGFALAHHAAVHWPEIEIVVASGRVKPRDSDLPDKATFIGKPFSAQIVRDHLRDKLPDGKKPQPLKQAS